MKKDQQVRLGDNPQRVQGLQTKSMVMCQTVKKRSRHREEQHREHMLLKTVQRRTVSQKLHLYAPHLTRVSHAQTSLQSQEPAISYRDITRVLGGKRVRLVFFSNSLSGSFTCVLKRKREIRLSVESKGKEYTISGKVMHQSFCLGKYCYWIKFVIEKSNSYRTI